MFALCLKYCFIEQLEDGKKEVQHEGFVKDAEQVHRAGKQQ